MYFHGKNELAAVALEASESKEPFPGAKVLPLDQKERSLLHQVTGCFYFIQIQKIKRFNPLLKSCTNKVHLLSVSVLHKRRHHLLKSIVMSTLIFSSKPLVPAEDGTRFGYPALMTCLYVYHALSFTVKEIVEEYE